MLTSAEQEYAASESFAVRSFRAVRSILPAHARCKIENLYAAALSRLPLTWRIQLQYFRSFRRFADLKAPQTFNEKCQRLKLLNPSYLGTCTNKVTAKDYVAARIGTSHIIPTLFHGPHLPPRPDRNWPTPFVVKTNHGSGLNIFIRGPRDLDWVSIENALDIWLQFKFGELGGELYYSQFRPEVLIEPFISQTGALPIDYKLFVFGGTVHCIQVDTDREFAHKRAFFDSTWTRLPFRWSYPDELREIPRPKCLDEMIRIATTLGADFSFVRIDLYEVDGKVYFGELGFTPDSGFAKFDPQSTDLEFGKLWHLEGDQ